MTRGRKLTTPEQDAQLLEAAELRDRLTNKALARELGFSEKQVKMRICYLRSRIPSAKSSVTNTVASA